MDEKERGESRLLILTLLFATELHLDLSTSKCCLCILTGVFEKRARWRVFSLWMCLTRFHTEVISPPHGICNADNLDWVLPSVSALVAVKVLKITTVSGTIHNRDTQRIRSKWWWRSCRRHHIQPRNSPTDNPRLQRPYVDIMNLLLLVYIWGASGFETSSVKSFEVSRYS